MKQLWREIDTRVFGTLGMGDGVLDSALQASAKAGMPEIQVASNQGKQLMLLARAIGAQRILEIGTLGGYSTIWLARGLASKPGAKVLTIEINPGHASVAASNVANAGLAELVEVVTGAGLDVLPKIAVRPPAAGGPPFDLVFIDANKDSAWEYFDWGVRLARPGGVVIVDNVVRAGEILNASSDDARVQGIRRLFERVANDGRVDATALQTVGEKGHDGYLMAVVKE
jgi:predicted O-methyltransferase YrrM